MMIEAFLKWFYGRGYKMAPGVGIGLVVLTLGFHFLMMNKPVPKRAVVSAPPAHPAEPEMHGLIEKKDS